ncbi:MAG: hypothetical protein KJT03_00535 [Verrucomicrobiae bacterium]|nr:hypothetical protein [Verrucomicrobiae bacterium]
MDTFLFQISPSGLVEESSLLEIQEPHLFCPLGDGSFIQAKRDDQSGSKFTLNKWRLNEAGEPVADPSFQPQEFQGVVLQVERFAGGIMVLVADQEELSNAQPELKFFDVDGVENPGFGQDELIKTLRLTELFIAPNGEAFLLAQQSVRTWFRLTPEGRIDPGFHLSSGFLFNETRLNPIPGGGYYLTGQIIEYAGQFNPGSVFRLNADGTVDPAFDSASLDHIRINGNFGIVLQGGEFWICGFDPDPYNYALYSIAPTGDSGEAGSLAFYQRAELGLSQWTPTGELRVTSYQSSPPGFSDALVSEHLISADGSVRASLPGDLSKALRLPVWIEKDGRWLTKLENSWDKAGSGFTGLIRFDESGNIDDQFINYYQDSSILGLLDDGRIMVKVILPSGNGERRINRLLRDGTPDPEYLSFEFNDQEIFFRNIHLTGDGTLYFIRAFEGDRKTINRILPAGGFDEMFSTAEFRSSDEAHIIANESGVYVFEPGMFLNGEPKPFGIKFSLDGVLDVSYSPESLLETEFQISYSIGGNYYAPDGSLFVIAKPKDLALLPSRGYPIIRIDPYGNISRVSGEEGWNRVTFRVSPHGDLLVIGDMHSEDTSTQGSVRYTQQKIPYSSAFSEIVSLSDSPVVLAFNPGERQGVSYQWIKDGALLPGQFSSSISFQSLGYEQAGNYQMKMRSSGEEEVTSPISLIAPRIPRILENPDSISAGFNADLELLVHTDGEPRPRVEWYKDSEKLDSRPLRILRLSGVDASDAGIYQARAYNDLGEVWSDPFVVELKGFFAEKISIPLFLAFPKAYGVSSDGSLFLAGDFQQIGDTVTARLLKLNFDGTVDRLFNPSGTVTDSNRKISRLLPTSGDGGVIAGYQPLKGSPQVPDYNSSLVKFDSAGLRTATVFAEGDNFIHAVCSFSDGSFVYSEGLLNGGADQLKRNFFNGSQDPGFQPPEFTGKIHKLHSRTDGGFFVESDKTNGSGSDDRQLLLLSGDGSIDPSFAVPEDTVILGTFMDAKENIWASIKVEYWDEVVRFEADGSVAPGFPQRPDWPFSINKIWFFQDGSALVADLYEAYGLNPDGSEQVIMPRGFFPHPHTIFSVFGKSIYAVAPEGPPALQRHSLQSSPIVWMQPEPRSASLDGQTTFSVTPWGNYEYTYQWLKGGVPITGAVEQNLTLTNVSREDIGLYSVILKLGALSVVSRAVQLDTHQFDGFPVKSFPLAVKNAEEGYEVSWKGESGYSYVLQLSHDIGTWIEDTRPLTQDGERVSARFLNEELIEPLFIRVRSIKNE